jgi:hypothetical protein
MEQLKKVHLIEKVSLLPTLTLWELEKAIYQPISSENNGRNVPRWNENTDYPFLWQNGPQWGSNPSQSHGKTAAYHRSIDPILV